MADSSAAVQVALDYYRAWTTGDFEEAMRFVAEDIVCWSPGGRLDGAEAFRGFMGPFARMLKRSELLAAYGDDTTAVLVYDTDTVLVDGAPGAELLTVADGRISQLRIIFDRAPFEAARQVRSKDDSAPAEGG